MVQKTIVITGGSDGIGAAAARELARRGDRLILVGRSSEKTARVAAELGAEYRATDFERLEDVRLLAEWINDRVERIDVLANNAGGVFGDRTLTPDGFEKTFQVNHLAPFLLTSLLLEKIRAARGSVVMTSSVAARMWGRIDLDDLNNENTYSAQKAYGTAKLENILFARELHARYHRQGISSVAFHPGNVASNFASGTNSWFKFIYRTPLARFLLIPVEEGGANLAWFLDGEPGVTWNSGGYYDQRVLSDKLNDQAWDPELATQLWERSAAMVDLRSS